MKKYIVIILCIWTFVVVFYSCQKPSPVPASQENPYLSAGQQTVFDQSSSAFGDDFPVLRNELIIVHDNGEAIFNVTFVPSPSTIAYQGLGPIYNNSSCGGCHAGLGEGNPPPYFGAALTSMLFRISIPGADPHGGPNPVPGFGGQLQNNATGSALPEGTVNIAYTNNTYNFADGNTYQLQTPTYILANTYTTFPANGMISPRVAPRIVGLGLLEAVPESELLQHVNNNLPVGDTSQINGKANYVWDYTNNQMEIGRFGWKAEAPTILQQTAGAYNQDMGLTNYVFPQESSYGQPQYQLIPGDPSPEISDSELNANVLYLQTIAVPARRNVYDAQVERGQQIFANAQCTSCHLQTLTTSVDVAFPEMSNITLHPYTDLLLHDMGAGLADNRPTYQATGRQWRTPPLWGLGLTQLVNPSGQFLHDGRARNLMEAILWHGGEAYQAKEYVRNLSASDRNALVAFLQSL